MHSLSITLPPVSHCRPCSHCDFVPAGAQPPEGERKLYLLIEGPTEAKVRQAKQEIRRVIEELVEKAMRRDVGAAGSRRYNIM
jgi:ATP-dependent RNA helicase DDX46/PRP5